MNAAASLSFVPMAVHVGEAVERIRELRGMPKTTLAERIGRSSKNLHELLRYPGWDTMLLLKACEVLSYNFFKLLADDFEPGATPSMAMEPQAPYLKKETPTGVDVTIRVNPNDPESARKLMQALKVLDS